jgi:hypothetical protein
MEIKFHLNETIEWYYTQLEFNFNLIHFNPTLIEFEFKFLNWIRKHWMNFKFHGNWTQIQYNFDSIKFNSNSFGFKIQLKINEMQIGARKVLNLLVIFIICDYGVEKKKNWKKKI